MPREIFMEMDFKSTDGFRNAKNESHWYFNLRTSDILNEWLSKYDADYEATVIMLTNSFLSDLRAVIIQS